MPPSKGYSPHGLVLCALALAFVAACGERDDGVQYFAAGGVHEKAAHEQSDARLNLDHTAVLWLEPAGSHDGDTGIEEGVDELRYHFGEPTELRLSLDDFDEAPTLVVLDGAGVEIARVDRHSGDAIITASGHHTFRFIHPHAGDPSAEPIPIFVRSIRPDPTGARAVVGSAAQASSGDVATLKAGKDCVRCNLQNLFWDACPGVTLHGVNLSHADFSSASLTCLTVEPKSDGTVPLLTGAAFAGATIGQSLLRGVDLTDANFRGANLGVTVFDSVTATAADFSGARFTSSTFGAAQGTGSSAQYANFSDAQIVAETCFSVYDLRGADFTGALFGDGSSVHGSWFAGANLYDTTFDGALMQYDSSLPHCGQSSSCTTVTVSGLCQNCPCKTDFGCLDLAGTTRCVQNQGAVSLSPMAVCQRPTVQAEPAGVMLKDTDLRNLSFAGADLTNSAFDSSQVDQTTDFSGTILGGVDFSQQNLGKAVNLSKAFLTQSTNFAGAVVTDAPATQRGVILSCDPVAGTGGCDFPAQTTQFKGADFSYAQLNHVGLSQADLSGAIFDAAAMVGADLSFTSLAGASFVGARLGTAPGSGGAATLRNAFMINVDLTDADLRSVDLTGAHLYGAESASLFVRTKLDSADLTNAILAGGIFTNATLTATVFNGAQLTNASFEGATLTNAKFDDAYLQGADFSTAASVTGMSLSNAGVSTTLTSTACTLTPPGTWTYKEQDGTTYTYVFGATQLPPDSSVLCPDNKFGPCSTGDSLCPVSMGPFPPIPECTPLYEYCYENCLTPPCYMDMPVNGICPFIPSCS